MDCAYRVCVWRAVCGLWFRVSSSVCGECRSARSVSAVPLVARRGGARGALRPLRALRFARGYSPLRSGAFPASAVPQRRRGPLHRGLRPSGLVGIPPGTGSAALRLPRSVPLSVTAYASCRRPASPCSAHHRRRLRHRAIGEQRSYMAHIRRRMPCRENGRPCLAHSRLKVESLCHMCATHWNGPHKAQAEACAAMKETGYATNSAGGRGASAAGPEIPNEAGPRRRAQRRGAGGEGGIPTRTMRPPMRTDARPYAECGIAGGAGRRRSAANAPRATAGNAVRLGSRHFPQIRGHRKRGTGNGERETGNTAGSSPAQSCIKSSPAGDLAAGMAHAKRRRRTCIRPPPLL